MKFLIRFILSAFIGCAIGLVLLMISEGVFVIVTSLLVAYVVAEILDGIFGKSSIRWLIKLAGGIIAFIVYFILLSYLNSEADGVIGPMIIFFAPYVLTVLAISYGVSNSDSNSSDNN
ncbi:MAG: hypothetical protein E7626_06520 [Ruminococcaceae bacterium]|nr:hypothetical protein [Oscillospiraceae bacterium]